MIKKIFFSILLLFSLCTISHSQDYSFEFDDPEDYHIPVDEYGLSDKAVSILSHRFRKPSHPSSFSNAKKRLYLFIKDPQTFYCGCNIEETDGLPFSPEQCGYVPHSESARSKRLEAEHILPASHFAKFSDKFPCYVDQENRRPNESSRKYCYRTDQNFRTPYVDLINLRPTVGELNAARSNYHFSEIPEETRLYGKCDFEIESREDLTEPAKSVRGDIARTYFYMAEKYGFSYPEELIVQFDKWNIEDPVGEDEKFRNNLIFKSQGSYNHFVSVPIGADDR